MDKMHAGATKHKMMILGLKEDSKLHPEEVAYGERVGKIIIF
jgi:hypothetical protein